MKNQKIISIILLSTLIQSCSGMNKQGAGTLIGGATGALIGAQFGKGTGALAATGLGAVAGAMIGSSIGKDLDDKDRKLMELRSQEALERLPAGSSAKWSNPDSGHSGYVTPTKTYQNSTGRYCREYTQVVNIGGEQKKAYGRACRQEDGQWEIVQ